MFRQKLSALMKTMFRYRKALLIAFAACCLAGFSALFTAYYILIVKYPGEHISKENIVKLLSVESPVYYADGKNLVGVFFAEEHRRYLKLGPLKNDINIKDTDEDYVPRLFLQALIASEDKKFYNHLGVDPAGILRAFLANLKAGRIVQGGSTLTQQCAKNIFRRQGRTYKQKFQELLNALRLEYHYTKDEILEFYCNQFYVTGNGRGLGIAARYYFNKKARELNLAETAYIVGSLKGPARYDPLIKQNKEEKKKTLERARHRTDYVLGNMYRLEMIDDATYKRAKAQAFPFYRGEFRYANSVILDYIREKLESDTFKALFEANGISNLATSGIKVYTTIDKDIQEGALYALRSHLSNLETILNGYKKPDNEDTDATPVAQTAVKEKEFYSGRIIQMVDKGKESRFFIAFNGVKGVIDYEGLKAFAQKLNTFNKGYYTGAGKKDVKKLFTLFKEGEQIYISLREHEAHTRQYLLDIEQSPQINGGVIVLNKGQVQAMAGGFSNRNYNRALYAKREPGSVFKPLVYLAALTLNWNNLDELINKRNVFVFQNQFYFPRPDHAIRSEKVSLTMAGVKSENVASVYLLNNLTNRLTKDQFAKIVKQVGLSQKDQETYKNYIKRIRDHSGIIASKGQLKNGIFEAIKEQMIPELTFSKEESQIFSLKHLRYGLKFDKKIKALQKQLARKKKNGPDTIDSEIETQINILTKNYLYLKKLSPLIKEKVRKIEEAFQQVALSPAPEGPSKYRKLFEHLYIYPPARADKSDKIIFSTTAPRDKELLPFTYKHYLEMLEQQQQETPGQERPLDRNKVLVEGLLSLQLIDDIEASINRTFEGLQGYRQYDLERLYYHKEFRILTGLLYVIKLAHRLGIDTELKPVLSFPLGTNSVALAETAKAYQTFLEGKKYTFTHDTDNNQIAVISRIEDSDGRPIYLWSPSSQETIPPVLGTAVSSILRRIVTHGTGRLADKLVKVSSRSLPGEKALSPLDFRFPTLGKTGTTNDYTNATFVGFLPRFADNASGLSLEQAYTIACYVGHDSNKEMRHDKGKIRISGASGALPVWIKIADHIIKSKKFVEQIDMVDMAFQTDDVIPLDSFNRMIDVPVDQITGLPLITESRTPNPLIFKTLGKQSNEEYFFKRSFQPISHD